VVLCCHPHIEYAAHTLAINSVGQVTVKIINKGTDAYKPDVYGEFIMVERRISKNGSNGYKIKNANGKTISTKREELTAICDHMSIQVDNPLTFLSQDSARQFLSSSTPEDKYKVCYPKCAI
jgi:chromosome segregation ATPase